MAFKTCKLSFVIFFMVALSFMVMKETYVLGCNALSGCFHARRAPTKIESRKLLAGFFKIGVNGMNSSKNGDQDLLNRELRMVPAGPDPLHHNGGSPTKPRTNP